MEYANLIVIFGIVIAVVINVIAVFAIWSARKMAVKTKSAEAKVRKLEKVIKKVSSKDDLVELELATTKQIIEELRKRPNNRFLMLVPHQKKEDVFVETHICNITPEAVLMLLKVAYDGVSDQLEGGEWSD